MQNQDVQIKGAINQHVGSLINIAAYQKRDVTNSKLVQPDEKISGTSETVHLQMIQEPSMDKVDWKYVDACKEYFKRSCEKQGNAAHILMAKVAWKVKKQQDSNKLKWKEWNLGKNTMEFWKKIGP